MLRRFFTPRITTTLRTPLTRSIYSSSILFQEQKKSTDAVAEVEKTEQIEEFETLSGAPADLTTNRLVRIYQEAKPATQSGTWGTNVWRIDWDIVPRANRWENDLMGWASSGDYMQATQMKFRTRDDAIRFALNQGWNTVVHEPNKRDFNVKTYAENFLHSSGKLKHIRTK